MTDKLKPDDPEQSKRFKEMAREIEVDERPDAFDRAFKKVIQPPRQDDLEKS
jgi:hypothetical protein